MLNALHHVQLAMPKGQEKAARDFYHAVLELDLEDKPATLAQRGGVWFRKGDLRVHLGVEAPFRPARKAHPAFLCDDLDLLARRLGDGGHVVQWDDAMPNCRRFYTEDPFGNRIECLKPDE